MDKQKHTTSILNGFVNKSNKLPIHEMMKGILDPSKIDNKKFDIFSKDQISSYVKSILDENIGSPIDIQKGIVDKTNEELGKLVSVNIRKGKEVKSFFIASKGSCLELLKATSPVNDDDEYFDDEDDDEGGEDDYSEDEILNFIKENNPSDDTLVTEFGDEVIDFLNKLHKAKKIEVDDEGNYILANSSSDEEPSEEQTNKPTEEQPTEQPTEEPSEEPSEEPDSNDNNEDTPYTDGDNMKLKGQEMEDNSSEQPAEEPTEEQPTEEQPAEEPVEEPTDQPVKEQPTEQPTDEPVEEQPVEEQPTEEPVEEQPVEQQPTEEPAKTDVTYTPEELEKFAKDTATASLITFYENSNDDAQKKVVAIELQRRGIDLKTLKDGNNVGGDELPQTQQELDELQNWVDNYFNDYDKEDLIDYVTDLALQSPAKRKDLKEHYRKMYSQTNGGNSVAKVDEEELKTYLQDTYFVGFSNDDLKDYALKLLAKNPQEFKKLKSAYKDFKDSGLI